MIAAGDAAADAIPAVEIADVVVAADGLVVVERAAGDGQVGVVIDRAGLAGSGERAVAVAAALGQVVDEVAVRDGRSVTPVPESSSDAHGRGR